MIPLVGALWAVRFTGGGHSKGEAVDLFEVFGGEADEAVEEAVFGAFPCDGFLSHFGKAGVVDADLCEGGREAELFFEVFPQAFDAFIFFDLPTGTPRERKAYMQFRKYLLHAGYDMLQYSVYVRIAGSRDDAQHMLGIVKRHLPGKGQVRALMVTEKQYATMQILLGKPTIAEKETGCQEMLVL